MSQSKANAQSRRSRSYCALVNATSGAVVLARAKWCRTYWCHLRGLMFRRDLPEDEGLLFVYGRESIAQSSIHMMFMNFDIATIWLNNDQRIVHKTLAKRWRLAYASPTPARYVIEARPSLLERVNVGDKLDFNDFKE